jgi:hypothetical protein
MEQTQECIKSGETIIYEATFMNNGLLIRSDIMVRNATGLGSIRGEILNKD